MTRTHREDPPVIAETLHSLGYRNSDLLFNDRLIFVEGESDQDILPILLSRGRGFRPEDVDRTGFPTMDGGGRLRGTAQQTSLIHYEKLLRQLGRSSLPRVYLFDGDCEQGDREVLKGTPFLGENQAATVAFLQRRETENYLLVPEAIAAAIHKLASMEGRKIPGADGAAIRAKLNELLSGEDEKLFPDGKGGDRERTVKASVALERLFGTYGLRYRKRTTGRLIAEHVTSQNQPGLAEIWDLVQQLFPQRLLLNPAVAAADVYRVK